MPSGGAEQAASSDSAVQAKSGARHCEQMLI
jgi:hypothetical protein